MRTTRGRRSSRPWLATVCALLVVAAGCGAGPEAPPPLDRVNEPTAGGGDDGTADGDDDGGDGVDDGAAAGDPKLAGDLTFAQQGGTVRGGAQELVISREGEAVLTTGNPDILAPVEFVVEDEQLSSVSAALDAADLSSVTSSTEETLDEQVDGDIYVFEQGQDRVTLAAADASAELRQLVEVLQGIIADAPQ